MRVAIVHERFTEYAGSERVVEQLHEIWPDARMHAPIVDRSVVLGSMQSAEVHATWLQRFYRGGPEYAYLLPLLPAAMRAIDLRGLDLVVTSHHAFANRVRPPTGVPIVSYTYTPARWIWDPAMLADEQGGRLGRVALAAFARTQRRADRAAAARLRGIIVISRHVAGRVRRWWGRDADVVPPPVDVHRFTPDPGVRRESFFLLAGRLVPYKRPLVAVEAARRAGAHLVVVGDGRLRHQVEDRAGPGIEVLGPVDDATLLDLYRRCRALVFPGDEDFGIVPVEAQACGAPVLARRVGGVLESVVPGVTGVFYGTGGDEVASLAEAMESFDAAGLDPDRIRAHAEGFAPERFRTQFLTALERILATPAPE